MTLPLHQVIDVPPVTPVSEFAHVVEAHFRHAFEKAARGDAQNELVELRVAYLNWAYARPDAAHSATHSTRINCYG